MRLNGIANTYKNIKRYKQILDILVKYGFDLIVEKFGILKRFSKRKKSNNYEYLTLPQRLKLALEELGPTFIKLGQILSTRSDIIPGEYIDELVKLQDNVKPFDSKLAREQFKKSISKDVENIFLRFEDKPIASGSIAQVHEAILKNGKRVVVKIQRPDIEKTINTDIDILFGIARFIESRNTSLRVYNPVGIIEEFSEALKKELDFTKEAWNIEKFNKNFEGESKIKIPEVYWDYTSQKMITMEYIDGIKIDSLGPEINDRIYICEAISKLYMEQIFIHGFFHADPHPGNILITKDLKIAYLDFGIMGRISKKIMPQFSEILIGVIEADEDMVTQALLDIGLINDEVNIDQIKLDVYDLIESVHGKTLNQIDIISLLNEVFKVAINHKIILPSEFILLIKTFITVEGLCRDIYKDFNIIETVKPYAEKLIKEKINIHTLIKELYFRIRNTNKHLMILPAMLNDFFKKANSGKLKVDFEHKGLDDVVIQFNKMVNKLVLSIILASLLVGSSLVIQVNRGPLVYGFPIIGVLGFTFSAVIGIWLIFTILRTGNM